MPKLGWRRVSEHLMEKVSGGLGGDVADVVVFWLCNIYIKLCVKKTKSFSNVTNYIIHWILRDLNGTHVAHWSTTCLTDCLMQGLGRTGGQFSLNLVGVRGLVRAGMFYDISTTVQVHALDCPVDGRDATVASQIASKQKDIEFASFLWAVSQCHISNNNLTFTFSI